jgi:phosphoribosylaminoimidazole (AIR) synthetase
MLSIGLRSSGVHSDCYSLVRKIIEQSDLEWDSPSSFADGTISLGLALLASTRLGVWGLCSKLSCSRLWLTSLEVGLPTTCLES